MKIDLSKFETSAQATTQICYNEETRNLDYRIKCEDFEDFKKCVSIIDRYNNFDHVRINKAFETFLNLKRYYNANNPNNGSDLFSYFVGRESSPALYVGFYNPLGGLQYIDEAGNPQDFESEDLERRIEAIKRFTDADEVHFVQDLGLDMVRLWWD